MCCRTVFAWFSFRPCIFFSYSYDRLRRMVTMCGTNVTQIRRTKCVLHSIETGQSVYMVLSSNPSSDCLWKGKKTTYKNHVDYFVAVSIHTQTMRFMIWNEINQMELKSRLKYKMNTTFSNELFNLCCAYLHVRYYKTHAVITKRKQSMCKMKKIWS